MTIASVAVKTPCSGRQRGGRRRFVRRRCRFLAGV